VLVLLGGLLELVLGGLLELLLLLGGLLLLLLGGLLRLLLGDLLLLLLGGLLLLLLGGLLGPLVLLIGHRSKLLGRIKSSFLNLEGRQQRHCGSRDSLKEG